MKHGERNMASLLRLKQTRGVEDQHLLEKGDQQKRKRKPQKNGNDPQVLDPAVHIVAWIGK